MNFSDEMNDEEKEKLIIEAAEEAMLNEITGNLFYPKCVTSVDENEFPELNEVFNNAVLSNNFKLTNEIIKALSFYYFFKSYNKDFSKIIDSLNTCFYYENIWIRKMINEDDSFLLIQQRINKKTNVHKYSIEELKNRINENKNLSIFQEEINLTEEFESIIKGNFNKKEAYFLIANRIGMKLDEPDDRNEKLLEKRVQRLRKKLKASDPIVYKKMMDEIRKNNLT